MFRSFLYEKLAKLQSGSTEIQKSVFRLIISKILMSLNLLNQTLTTSTEFSIVFMR
jgi:hypothetical protein